MAWGARARTLTRTTVALPALTVAATYFSVLLAAPDAHTWPAAAALAAQLILPAALASAAFLSIACRLYPRDGVAWLAAAAAMVGVQSFPLLAVRTGRPLGDPNTLFSTLLAGVLLLVAACLARRHSLRASPVGVGVGIGIALVVARAAWEYWPLDYTRPELPRWLDAASGLVKPLELVLLVAVPAAIGVLVSRVPLPAGSRRISVSVVLWSVGVGLGAMGWTANPALALAAIAACTITCVLFSSAALDLLWDAVRADQAAALGLQLQLRTLRAHARQDIEHLHEVKGSIAGIASATDLIRHEARLSSQHRRRLEDMLATEAARLQRLINAQSTRGRAASADLDDVIRPLVLSRQAQGQDVTWQPTGVPIRVESDVFAEVVSILLHNAGVHAPGSKISVFTRMRDDGELELVVADDGPGVPPDLRQRIFEWGFHDLRSDGQGVGLARASTILTERGLSLTLDPDHHQGAAFVVGLPGRTMMTASSTRTVLAS